MRRTLVVLAVLMLAGAIAYAATSKEKEKEPQAPTVIAVNGEYMGYMISDSGNRSVLIVNTRTGSFEVHDIDRQGMDRKTQEIYYSAVKYDREKGTRSIVKYNVNEGLVNASEANQ